jgi:hypothetical protein
MPNKFDFLIYIAIAILGMVGVATLQLLPHYMQQLSLVYGRF